ncbi:ATP-binding protein [Photorhabdus asymbiotica]|uniref:ATP-binding protein n=1 Tax=Photorhabdus asymbiotica TaxID=291112 RepID=UPI003DA78CB3
MYDLSDDLASHNISPEYELTVLLSQTAILDKRIRLRIQELMQQQTLLGESGQTSFDDISFSIVSSEQQKSSYLVSPHQNWTKEDFPPEPIPSRSRLGQLVERFDLTQFEIDLILLCLLPHLDRRYLTLFSLVPVGGGNNSKKQMLTLGLALELLCPSVVERNAQRASLLPQAPLWDYRLLQLRGDMSVSYDEIPLAIDNSLMHWLLGHDALPISLLSRAHWLPVPEVPDILPDFTNQLIELCQMEQEGMLTIIAGGAGSGSKTSVARAASQVGRSVLLLSLASVTLSEHETITLITLALREAQLRNACLMFEALDEFCEARPALQLWLENRLARCSIPLFCQLPKQASLLPLDAISQVVLSMPIPSLMVKAEALASMMTNYFPDNSWDVESLVTCFHPSPLILKKALSEAEIYRRLRGETASLRLDDVQMSLRFRLQQNFGRLAQRITPQRTFDDLIISESQQQQLQEILAAIRQRDRVLEQGFARKVSYGTGISTLFFGESGTGKTMVAEVLAGVLGVDLIKVDLSTVVNKYIGETEKNLARVFDYAQEDAGVLFFDEADALFGKRSETKDAKDRHANIEVSYLLQRLESYPGLVILATNYRNHLDSAFSRRLTFSVRFSFPDVSLRERMWRIIWPSGIQLADDISFSALAKRAELTGANIRNIALLASWLAVDEGNEKITMAHIECALRRELSKVGRIDLP